MDSDGGRCPALTSALCCRRYAFGVVFNALTLGLGSEARGLTVHCGLLHGHNVYSLGLVLVTGEWQPITDEMCEVVKEQLSSLINHLSLHPSECS